ncbi:MAG: phosphatase PAP2 family protein [Candidatus Pacebacteria bacterium]|nr:phosphatase PAP2 family protein [Candidatus Paceibacterota bacterium]
MNYDSTLYFNTLTQEYAFLEFLAYWVARYGDIIMILGIIVFLIAHNHKNQYICIHPVRITVQAKEVLASLSVGFITWILVIWIKFVTAVQRPFLSIPEIEPLFVYTRDMSFPSGHTAFFTALGVSLFWEHKQLGVVVCFLALVIGLARVMSGIHFISDILAGFLLGIIVAVGIRILGRKGVRTWIHLMQKRK